MEADNIPDQIKALLLKHIDSVGTLEVLLLLYGEPARLWTAQGVSDNLRTNVTLATAQLDVLAAAGLAFAEPGEPRTFRFRNEAPGLDEQVRALASFYGLRHTTLVEFIHGAQHEKLRALADAFKFPRGGK